MRNWKRIIVGDAFRLPSRNPNYYRDLILLPPFTLFTLAAVLVSLVYGITPENMRFLEQLTVGSMVCILLAKERLYLVAGALGFVAFRFLVGFVLDGEWLMLLGFGGTAGALWLVYVLRGNWSLSYEFPEGSTVLEMALGVASLGASIALLFWISPYTPKAP